MNSANVLDGRGYDIMHVTPTQSAPDWVKASPLADPASPLGNVRADRRGDPEAVARGGGQPAGRDTRQDMYLLKRHGLPALYWQGMLKGRALPDHQPGDPRIPAPGT